ncbi:MAG: hypothetical protein KDJ17_11990 [Hyphomicrobiaceae bacterium]|nr:hypothetical protein [Hyphomicrobiaceae bacterium]
MEFANSGDRSLSRAEKRLQDLAYVPKPRPVRPPVRAMTAPDMSAVSLAAALDHAETARMVRMMAIEHVLVETVAAVAVAAAQPTEEVRAKTVNGSVRYARKSKSRRVARLESSRRALLASAKSERRDAPTPNTRSVEIPLPANSLQPSRLHAVTPGALMFAGFIERQS